MQQNAGLLIGAKLLIVLVHIRSLCTCFKAYILASLSLSVRTSNKEMIHWFQEIDYQSMLNFHMNNPEF